jgi:phage terminase small subunit
MPNHRKPDNVHHLKGTWRRDRHGVTPHPVVPMDTKAPTWLDPEEVKTWDELASACKDYLAQSDRAAVELAARLLAASRAGTAKAAHEALLVRMLDKLGATPEGRARLQPINAGVEPGNPFETL